MNAVKENWLFAVAMIAALAILSISIKAAEQAAFFNIQERAHKLSIELRKHDESYSTNLRFAQELNRIIIAKKESRRHNFLATLFVPSGYDTLPLIAVP